MKTVIFEQKTELQLLIKTLNENFYDTKTKTPIEYQTIS